MDVETPNELTVHLTQTQTGLFYIDETETGCKWYFKIVLK